MEYREVEICRVPLAAEMYLSKGWSFETCVFSMVSNHTFVTTMC